MKVMWFFTLAVIFAFVTTANAQTQEIIPRIQATIDKVFEIMKNKELSKPQKTAERRALIRKAVTDSFDFEEMAKRSLGVHWNSRTKAEQKEFVTLFIDLLERSYIKRVEENFEGKVIFLDEKIEGDLATVKSKVITKNGTEIPIDYKFTKKANKWEVYDLTIEGVSLVNNYRTQFNKIIRSSKNGYDDLIKMMKNKKEEELFNEKGK